MKQVKQLELPSNKRFGIFFTSVFAFASVYFFSTGSIFYFYGAGITSFLFGVVTLINPELLHPLNRLWMSLGLLLGKIVSPIVMGVIFFALFTSISLLMRLFGRDELRLKLKKRTSHWRIRQHSYGKNTHFENQF